jgi:CubicO group peptidase (beta-lactamase class C family)
MLVHRRITLACAVAAMAVAPSSALAMPATDQPAPATQSSPAPVVRAVETSGDDTTLALILSGSALLVAAGAAAVSGHDHRRLGKVA